MADYDGEIKLSVSLSSDDVIQSSKRLQKSIQDIFDKTSGQQLDSKFQRLQSQMSKSVTKAQELQSAMERLEDTEVPTQEYQEIQKQIDKATDALVKLLDKQEKFIQTGGDTSSKVYKGMEYDVEQLRNTIEYAESELQELVETGKAFTLGSETAQYDILTTKLGDVNNEMRILITSSEQAGQAASNTQSRFESLKSTLASLGSTALSKIKSALVGLVNKFKQAGKAASNFSNKLSLSKILSYAVGIRGLFSVFTHLRSAIVSGLQTMAKFNNGMNTTNAALTQLVSSFNLVKGSIATAFAPLLTYVTPMLSGFMQKLADVITMVGMFIAKLTGAKSYMKATFKSTDYAGSLSSGSSGKSAQQKYEEAVKKAQEKYDKQVAKITKKNEEAEAKAAEKNAQNAAKAEEEQAKAAEKLAKAQEKANNKLAAFDDLNVLGIEDTEDETDALKELEEVQANLAEMPELELPNLEDFLGSGGGGAGDPFGLEEVPLDGFEWNWDDLLAKARELGEKLADFLNDIFKDEDLAKKIGEAIGNLINMAINFAYGFIHNFDFLQFGHWLGTMFYEAIKTIDWELLGTTIAEGLNGLADVVIGFFERYPVGTLGDAISRMLNAAIETIDPEKIGLAMKEVLQAPLLELREVLTETNWAMLADKLSKWFHELFSKKGLKSESLGETIGKTLGSAINAAVDFLLGLDIAQIVTDIAMFFSDIFISAAKEIDWFKVLEAIVEGLFGIIEGLGNAVSILGGEIAVALEEAINDKLHIEIFKQEDIDRQKKEIELLREGLITTGDIAQGTADQIAGMYQKIGEGTTYSFEQLVRYQEGCGLTNEQIQNMIQSMQDYADKNHEVFDAASLGLQGYTGDWEHFRDVTLGIIDENAEKLKGNKDVINDLSDTTEKFALKSEEVGNRVSETAEKTGEKVDHTALIGKDHLGILDEAFKQSDQTATESSENMVSALDSADTKTGEVKLNFETMTEELQLQLENLTTLIDTWYQEMILNYFGYDAWALMLQEGILLALTDFFVNFFFIEWDLEMELWWNEHVLVWFLQDKWQSEIFTPFFEFLKLKWKNLIEWWDKSVKEWYEDLQKKWKSFMEKVDKALKDFHEKLKKAYDKIKEQTEETFQRVEEIITEHIEAAKEVVLAACEEMLAKLEEVLSKIEEVSMAMETGGSGGGGGGGSKSGGGGSAKGSGGGKSSSFMPMLDVMHFEDNLGMSAFKFPELATGAVIPPNNEFLAVLGDQSHGTNIETPLAVMLEAFRSVMDEYMGGNRQSATMEVDGETFARLMMPHIMDEMHRLGYNTEIIEGV